MSSIMELSRSSSSPEPPDPDPSDNSGHDHHHDLSSSKARNGKQMSDRWNEPGAKGGGKGLPDESSWMDAKIPERSSVDFEPTHEMERKERKIFKHSKKTCQRKFRTAIEDRPSPLVRTCSAAAILCFHHKNITETDDVIRIHPFMYGGGK